MLAPVEAISCGLGRMEGRVEAAGWASLAARAGGLVTTATDPTIKAVRQAATFRASLGRPTTQSADLTMGNPFQKVMAPPLAPWLIGRPASDDVRLALG
ncbi:hypothetical protein E5345_11870 [Propionibacterium sp. NM47_B9-13]|uniref:Uncharacterized protein n=1 Tax=Cutibacterium modestum HL044PA1 TaxID=765109 RepID=A0ABP2K8S3_9ACTN|nr:hypothetical protein HMPREF9621_00898 [Cutibacterium modestum HL037PA2]EFS93333.1 hypothetical protein HMPREF9607_00546 [Cutibacterium modestum HL044PA1]EFT15669.1 hypothetical protein HMPREF9622_01286 [Cutibacterium modestum HL037PA3]TGY27659.1 hypothetical protein E5345_11870 [Propionibacterium sp. NM47_B9-13]